MNSTELKNRTQNFAVDIIEFVDKLPKNRTSDIIGKQLVRSACSVGANYRAVCRAQSYSHFISKLGIVEEESDESLYWLEIAIRSGITKDLETDKLVNEANELTAIFTAARKTSKYNKKK
jgi:four helix bundle protein